MPTRYCAIFLFLYIYPFYTLVLVVVILNLCGLAKVAYEAGHCLHGQHEFG
jgi:hypothetical protein